MRWPTVAPDCVPRGDPRHATAPPIFLYRANSSRVTVHRDWALRASRPHLGTALGAREPVRARERPGPFRASRRRLHCPTPLVLPNGSFFQPPVPASSIGSVSQQWSPSTSGSQRNHGCSRAAFAPDAAPRGAGASQHRHTGRPASPSCGPQLSPAMCGVPVSREREARGSCCDAKIK